MQLNKKLSNPLNIEMLILRRKRVSEPFLSKLRTFVLGKGRLSALKGG